MYFIAVFISAPCMCGPDTFQHGDVCRCGKSHRTVVQDAPAKSVVGISSRLSCAREEEEKREVRSMAAEGVDADDVYREEVKDQLELDIDDVVDDYSEFGAEQGVMGNWQGESHVDELESRNYWEMVCGGSFHLLSAGMLRARGMCCVHI